MDIKDLLLKLSPYPVYVIVLYEGRHDVHILVWLLKNETFFRKIWKCPNKTLILRINILIRLTPVLNEWRIIVVTVRAICFWNIFFFGVRNLCMCFGLKRCVHFVYIYPTLYKIYISSFHCNIFTEPHINLISIYVFLLPHSRNTKYIEIQLNISSTYIGS